MGDITHTMDSQFTADTVKDIYKILMVGNEWSPYTRPEVGIDKPRVLPRSKRNSETFLQTNVANPRLGTNDSGGVDFTYRLLEVAEFMTHYLIDPSDWQDEFPEFRAVGPQLNLALNPVIAQAVIETTLNGIHQEVSALDYQGDDSTGGVLKYYDGFNTLALADSDVIDVGNLGVITVNNILSILEDVKQSIPFRMWNRRSEYRWFMNSQDYLLAQEANKSTQNSQTIMTVGEVKKYEGVYEMVPMESVPKNTIFCAIGNTGSNSNLVKGYWFENDVNNFLIGREADGDQNLKFLLRAQMGVQYRTGTEIVLYTGS